MLDERIQREETQPIAQLRARIGKFATPEQTAVTLMAEFASPD